MQNEGQYIVELIRSVLENRAPEVNNEGVNFDRLYKLAEFHYVAVMCYYSLKDVADVPEETLKLFRKSYDRACAKEAIQEIEVQLLLDEFEKAGIKHMPLKGFVLKNIYPRPDMRLSADVDILFDEKDSGKVREIMLENGYTDESEGGNHDVYHKKPVMNVEMHKKLVNVIYDFHSYFDDTWDKAVLKEGYKYRYEFNVNDFYIFQMAHLYKHFSKGGAGIRSVLDTYLYLKTYGDLLDREYLNREFEKVGIRHFAKVYEDLSLVWFDHGFKDDELSMYILSSGTFGIRKNTALSMIMKKKGKTDNVFLIKVKYVFYRIFLPYRTMKTVFPVLKRLPFLLPLFWVVRLVRAIFKRGHAVKDELSVLKNINEEGIEEREDFRNRTGL